MTGIHPLGNYGFHTTSGTGSSADGDSAFSGAAKTVDKSEFLKLLVVQLQNQDPLSPIKNENFVAQMATFSSLEQLIDINKAVTKLAETDNTSAAGNEVQQKRA